jgi:hypothetical protein
VQFRSFGQILGIKRIPHGEKVILGNQGRAVEPGSRWCCDPHSLVFSHVAERESNGVSANASAARALLSINRTEVQLKFFCAKAE